MLLNREGDIFITAFSRVHQRADLPFKGSKFNHSLRHEITFGELRRLLRFIRVSADFRSEFPR